MAQEQVRLTDVESQAKQALEAKLGELNHGANAELGVHLVSF